MDFIKEFWEFLKVRKKYWLLPIVIVLVLFGGGSPTGAFGNAIVQTASAGILNMNNAGDFVTLYNTNSEVVLTFDIEPLSNNPNESYTRYPRS